LAIGKLLLSDWPVCRQDISRVEEMLRGKMDMGSAPRLFLLILQLQLIHLIDAEIATSWKDLGTAVGAAKPGTETTLTLSSQFENSDYASTISIGTASGTAVNITIIGSGAVLDAQNKGRAFKVLKGAELTLRDVTIQGGHSTNDHQGGEQGGGAVQVQGVMYSFGVTFQKSWSGDKYGGGAIAVNAGGIMIMEGGAVTNNGQDPSSGKKTEIGGGILVTGVLKATGVKLNQNTAESSGGAISVNRGTVELVDCQIENNNAPAGSAIEGVQTSMVTMKTSSLGSNQNPDTELQFQTGASLFLDRCQKVAPITKMFSVECAESSTCCPALNAAPFLKLTDKLSESTTIIIVAIACTFVLVLAIAANSYNRKQHLKRRYSELAIEMSLECDLSESLLGDNANGEHRNSLEMLQSVWAKKSPAKQKRHAWQIKYADLVMKDRVGSGAYGQVFEGESTISICRCC
jgi:predicted outer membrane repeat protein